MMKCVTGFTLLECLVAMLLGSLLMIGLLEVYRAISESDLLQQDLANLQQNQRFASFYLTKKIHMAGYLCDGKKNNFVQGYRANAQPASYAIDAKSDTDILLINTCSNDNKQQPQQHAYFIADSHRKDSKGEIIYSLYEKKIPGHRQELIEGVDEMKLQYDILGVYYHASNVADWQQVRAVKLSILFYSQLHRWCYLVVALRELK